MFNSIVKTKRTSSEVIHVPSYSYSVRVIAPPSTVDESIAGIRFAHCPCTPCSRVIEPYLILITV